MRALILALLLAGCAEGAMNGMDMSPRLADAPAMDLLERRCAACHPTELILSSVGTETEWMAVVHRMLYHHKAKLLTHATDEEGAALAAWLAATQEPAISGVRIGPRPTGRPL